MLNVPSLVLAVDPVPWARAQMAFTLAAHIILVPLGVSWAFMVLVANYRAIKKNDADALLLAQRWSKYMAVTFAVGAVTGTGAHVRVRAALADLHGSLRRRLRHPVHDRRPVLLHRGDLPRDLHLRLEAPEAVAALLDRRPHRDRGDRRHRVGGRGERVDERTIRIHAELGGQGRRRQPGRRDLQQGLSVRGRAHVGRGVPRGRLLDRIRVRLRNVARETRPVSPARLHHPVHGGCHRRADPDARRRPGRAGSTTTNRRSSPPSSSSRRRRPTCRRRCSGT